MREFPDYYPPTPRRVPADLTEPSAPFRKQMNLFGVSVLLFFALYFGLIMLLAIGVVFCVTTPGAPSAPGQPNAWGILRWLVAGLLCVPIGILIKNLFHKEQLEKDYSIEIFPDDHPKLFRFLECVCAETGAPMPDRVMINHEINAAAGSEISVASLFSKPERTLFLGLGLLNVLNMTEFKAVLAHEFGHFSQQSMQSAPYARLGMLVINNILHGTHFGLDKVMDAIFFFMVKLHLALKREMEFHADLVAVSVAGSDAIPQLLFKCWWAEACMQQTMAELDMAREHDLYSRDVFVPQIRAGKHLRRRQKDPNFGEPPALPDERSRTMQLFRPEEDELAEMWSDHPSNYDRELNAKADYIRSDFDDSTPWTLFGDLDGLRREVSMRFYRQAFRVKASSVKWSSPEKVQAFLNEERAETSFDEERYGTLYNNRNLQALDPRALRTVSDKKPNVPEELLAGMRSLYSARVKRFGEVHQRHIEEHQMLTAIVNRWYRPKGGRFKMRNQRFQVREAREILRDLEKELEADTTWLRAFDTKVFVTYYELEQHLNPALAEELHDRYQFHFVIQGMWSILQGHKAPMSFMFDLLDEIGNQMDEDTFHLLIDIFRQAYEAFELVLEESALVHFPKLANMPAGESMRPFLLKGRLANKPSHFDEMLSVKWLVDFANQFQDVDKHLDRLHFKSLGNILSLQENIGARAEKKWGALVPGVAG